MTAAEEVTFIALWQEGASYRQIAAALKCSISSMAAWAIPLIVDGKIEARSPQQQALARQAAGTEDGVSGRVSTRVSKPVPVEVLPSLPTPAGNPEMTPLLHEFCRNCAPLPKA